MKCNCCDENIDIDEKAANAINHKTNKEIILICEKCIRDNKNFFIDNNIPYFIPCGNKVCEYYVYPDNVEKLKKITKKSYNDFCDHCNNRVHNPTYLANETGHISWCWDCIKKDSSLLEEKNIKFFDFSKRKNYNFNSWHLNDEYANDIKSISKLVKSSLSTDKPVDNVSAITETCSTCSTNLTSKEDLLFGKCVPCDVKELAEKLINPSTRDSTVDNIIKESEILFPGNTNVTNYLKGQLDSFLKEIESRSDNGQSLIKAILKDLNMPTPINYKSIKVGDILELEIENDASFEKRTAVVFSTDTSPIKVILDKKYVGSAGESWAIKKDISNLGLGEIEENLGWDICSQTKINKVIERAILKEKEIDIKDGSIVELSNSGKSFGIGNIFYNIEQNKHFVVFHKDRPFKTNIGVTLSYNPETKSEIKILEEKNINPKDVSIYYLDNTTYVSRIFPDFSVEKTIAKEIAITDLASKIIDNGIKILLPGDVVELEVTIGKKINLVKGVILDSDTIYCHKPIYDDSGAINSEYITDPEKKKLGLKYYGATTSSANSYNFRKDNVNLKKIISSYRHHPSNIGEVFKVKFKTKEGVVKDGTVFVRPDTKPFFITDKEDGYNCSYSPSSAGSIAKEYGIKNSGYRYVAYNIDCEIIEVKEKIEKSVGFNSLKVGDVVDITFNLNKDYSCRRQAVVYDMLGTTPKFIFRENFVGNAIASCNNISNAVATHLDYDPSKSGQKSYSNCDFIHEVISHDDSIKNIHYIKPESLQVGDVIDISYDPTKTGKSTNINGVVVSIENTSKPIIVTKDKFPSLSLRNLSEGSASYGNAQKFGYSTYASSLILDQEITVINKVIGKEKIKSADVSNLKIGDIVHVCCVNAAPAEAVVVDNTPNKTVVAFTKDNEFGWAAHSTYKKCEENAKLYDLKYNSAIYRLIDSGSIITKIIGKKSIASKNVKPGDRVKIEVNRLLFKDVKNELPQYATVLENNGSSVHFLLDEVYVDDIGIIGNSKFPNESQINSAKSIGIDLKRTDPRIWSNSYNTIIITEINPVEDKKEIPMYKPGVRLKLKIRDKIVNATAIGVNHVNKPLVFLDECYKGVYEASFNFINDKNRDAVKNLKLNPDDEKGWTIDPYHTVVLGVIDPILEKQTSQEKKEITFNDLSPGDRIEIVIADSDSEKKAYLATVLNKKYNGLQLVALDEPHIGPSYKSCKPGVLNAEDEAFEYDIQKDHEVCFTCDPFHTKLVQKLKNKTEINYDSLNIGDRIEFSFYDYENEELISKEATYVGIDNTSWDKLPTIYLDEYLFSDELESWKSIKDSNIEKISTELGFPEGGNRYLYLDGAITVNKIIKKSPKDVVDYYNKKYNISKNDVSENIKSTTENLKKETIDHYSLNKGDRITVEINLADYGNDLIVTTDAVVVDPNYIDGPLIVCDKKIGDGNINESFALADADIDNEYAKIAKKLKLSYKEDLAWSISDSDSVVKILSTYNNKKGESDMFNEDGDDISFGDMIKTDATDAAYRVASTQMTKGVKAGLLAILREKGVEGGKVEAMRELLDSPIGDAIVSAVLGFGLTQVPGLNEDERVLHLAKEFRVNGMATAGNVVADSVLTHVLPAITSAMENLPPVSEMTGGKKSSRKRLPTVEKKETGSSTAA